MTMTGKTTVDLTDGIDTIKIDFAQFEQVIQCPVQRNHNKRAKEKKTREKLSTLQSQHCCVAIAVLTQDSYDPTSGVTYLAGNMFMIDGHTRREFWRLGYSDRIPSQLLATRFYVATIRELRELYYTFDNSSNVEKPSDLAYGACRLLNLQLKNHKLYDVGAFTWAAHYHNKNLFTKAAGYDGHGIINIYSLFRSEVEFLDSFKWETPYRVPGPLRSAALLFLKKYNDDAAKEIVRRVLTNDFYQRDANGKYDAVTHMILWLVKPGEEWAQSYATIPVFMEKFLYWFNQAHLEATKGKERVAKKGNHAGLLDEYVQQASINPFVAAA